MSAMVRHCVRRVLRRRVGRGRWARAAVLVALAAGGLGAPKRAMAGGGLEVEKWLARPGVRLLAVEFYATWCKPCMEAVPRWAELHERYASEGLRLVVVNTLDPEGGCASPGWNPDDLVCDLEGDLQERMGVGGALPSAFLWTWQGELLVERGHIDKVERAVRRFLAQNPRVHVEATDAGGRPDRALRHMVVDELSSLAKLTVVADAEELRLLRQLRERSHDLAKRTDQQCEVGAEASANTLLKARVLDADRPRLSLSMYSVESGCQIASHHVGYNAERPKAAVREAVAGLHDKMRRPLEAPVPLPTGGRQAAGAAATTRSTGPMSAAVDAAHWRALRRRNWSKEAGTLGLVGAAGTALLGWKSAEASEDGSAASLPLGIGSLLTMVVLGPVVQASAASTRDDYEVPGSPLFRLLGWVGFGFAIPGGVTLLAVGKGEPPPVFIHSATALTALSSVMLSMDAYVTAWQADEVGPDLDATPAEGDREARWRVVPGPGGVSVQGRF